MSVLALRNLGERELREREPMELVNYTNAAEL